MNEFETDPRRLQELRCRPYADKIYKDELNCVDITRTERTSPRDDNAILDSQFAIDTKLRLPNGQPLTGQEKFLSEEYAHWATVTVEYEQNPETGEIGDWGNCAAQFYFVGYENPGKGFYPWILLNWPAVVLATNNDRIKWFDNINKNGRAKASFRYVKMIHIPDDCVIAGNYKTPIESFTLRDGKIVRAR